MKEFKTHVRNLLKVTNRLLHFKVISLGMIIKMRISDGKRKTYLEVMILVVIATQILVTPVKSKT